jgi:hypothetical protein
MSSFWNHQNELSSLAVANLRLGNSTTSETFIRGFGEKDVLSPRG